MSATENIDDYREATANEKKQWEAKAEFVPPSETLIATATGMGAVYNSSTGFFELNTLVDITEQQMWDIIKAGSLNGRYPYNPRVRTNFINIASASPAGSIELVFNNNDTIEVVSWAGIQLSTMKYVFYNCKKLNTVLGDVNVGWVSKFDNVFTRLPQLENIRIQNLISDISFGDSPLLSYDSVECLIRNRDKTNAITIKLNESVYVKICNETNAEYEKWHPLLALAESYNITLST